ncbi:MULTISPECIES: hypothetical protein [unclassified Streptomyces]|uniref:hypothetical protein n=1 Tax=unclassified Streptomyces TaxID=2593676 RepID=UPI0027407DC4|nr:MULTISPECIES: hypothetical protein [unclassified Streptomyces]
MSQDGEPRLSGFGVRAPGRRPGEWSEAWRPRLPLCRIALTLELRTWFTVTGRTHHLPALDRELRRLVGEAVRED